MGSLRDKLHKKDSKSRLSSSDSSRGRMSSGERKALGSMADKSDEKADPAAVATPVEKKTKESSKDKDCVVS